MKYIAFLALTLSLSVSARPTRRASFTLQNGLDAIALNNQFKTLTANSSCNTGDVACVGSQFAECANGAYVTTPCAAGTICAALPLVNSAGTSVTCTTQSDLDARIAATGADNATSSTSSTSAAASSTAAATNKGKNNSNSTSSSTKSNKDNDDANNSNSTGNSQTSLTLDPSVIAQGFTQNGLNGTNAANNGSEAGLVASLTSQNNFINFCAGQLITNGTQFSTASCNPAPMGQLPAFANSPSCKFSSPKNMQTLKANETFEVNLAITNMETGNFVNADTNFLAAPQQLNQQGLIKGHSHVVIQQLSAIDQTTVPDVTKFAFFKGLNDPAQNGVLSVNVTGGLPAGVYKISSINTGSNHAPVLLTFAQHSHPDDQIYITVTADGK